MEQRWQTPPDLRSSLLRPLYELKSHGFDTLLQSLFGDLKVVQPPAPRHMLSLVLGSLGEGLGGGQQHVLSLVVGCWGGPGEEGSVARAESSAGGLREGLGGWSGALRSRNEDLAGGSLSIGQIQGGWWPP